jgi:hypothetical protein
MCVGVMCACMPAIAKFTNHTFPDFSVVDSLMSLKIFSFSSSARSLRSRSKNKSSDPSLKASYSGKQGFHKPTRAGESDENLTEPWAAVMPQYDVEMGAMIPQKTKTRILSGGAVEVADDSRIHMQREWAIDHNKPTSVREPR